MEEIRIDGLQPEAATTRDGHRMVPQSAQAALHVAATLDAMADRGITVKVQWRTDPEGPIQVGDVRASYDPSSGTLKVPELALDASATHDIGDVAEAQHDTYAAIGRLIQSEGEPPKLVKLDVQPNRTEMQQLDTDVANTFAEKEMCGPKGPYADDIIAYRESAEEARTGDAPPRGAEIDAHWEGTLGEKLPDDQIDHLRFEVVPERAEAIAFTLAASQTRHLKQRVAAAGLTGAMRYSEQAAHGARDQNPPVQIGDDAPMPRNAPAPARGASTNASDQEQSRNEAQAAR